MDRLTTIMMLVSVVGVMVEHCEADVLVLRDVYAKLKPMVHILHR
jgi:hypothetical protein